MKNNTNSNIKKELKETKKATWKKLFLERIKLKQKRIYFSKKINEIDGIDDLATYC